MRETFQEIYLEQVGTTYLKRSDYEEIVQRLDIYYSIVKRQIINYQSAVTGLFPMISNDGEIGSVRDSIYCAAAIWSLHQAYRRIDDDRGKSYELGQTAVKCMRGILECWIKQASKIELFKKNQCNINALHCKFHLITGDQIYSDSYPHLQVDVISLYLLYLVQMITSGLQIIYTQDEVAFIQNLVYYVERAYRTPDFGMWERGTKYNNGTPELHASSIGMAKSALEAVNGCNLFGDQGASWSVIYVDIDAHNRNRSIFDTMLPRESSSKDIDAALLLTVSYPAFATHQEDLVSSTQKNVIEKLRGKYGIKRFRRDGFKTALEDKNRQYYREGETKEFENVECEWPIFYIYMIIDGVFKNHTEQIKEYQNLLKSLIEFDSYGDPLVPMYFYVSFDDIESERLKPGKAIRLRSPEGSTEDGIFLWGQAIFVISQLLTDGLLHINELDCIRRYLPPHNRPRKSSRYSNFQGTATDLVVQIVLIAESMRLQAMMATYGIQTQTPHQVEPVQIWSSSQLVKVYEKLGVNSKLNLYGRPARPFGVLGTSKIYRIYGVTVLCYPLVFEVSEFYLYRDMALLIDDIKTELQFVGRHWRLSGRPTVCLLIREEHMRDPQFNEMLDLMALLKKGCCNGTKVRIGRLQNLISSSCVEHLDFMNVCDPDEFQIVHFSQLEHDYIGYQSLTDVSRATYYSDETVILTKVVKADQLNNERCPFNISLWTKEQESSFQNLEEKSLIDVIEDFRNTNDLRTQCHLLSIILYRENEHYEVDGISIRDHLKNLYSLAGIKQCWNVVRQCSSLLHYTVDSISPFITAVLVNGKQLTIGVIGHEEIVVDKPMIPAEIQALMYNKVQPYDVIQAVLQQEIVLYCGRLIATEPQMFKGILKIRVGWVLEAMKLYLSIRDLDSKPLECLSPHRVRQLLYKVLSVKEWASSEKLGVFERRQLEGCLCRVPSGFYDQVWDVLCRTPYGIRIGSCEFPQQPTLTNMTRSELNFALLVEEMLNHISLPEYRQIIVELLNIVSTILIRNPELKFQMLLDLDLLVSEAFILFSKDNNLDSTDGLKPFFSAPSSVTTGYLARAVVNNLLQGCNMFAKIDSDDANCKIT